MRRFIPHLHFVQEGDFSAGKLKTSATEGETLNPDAVRSSVGRRLGIPDAGLKHVQDPKANGLVQILLDE
ncbi:MAG: DUF4172 domain-containing protein [Desulfobacteraceae bacterium]|nr:DUF4172 domain-containing protein [Desulfobacteraceae bacterium]